MLVGGLGSSSGDAAAFEVDVAALGYALSDVIHFSYRGGTTAEAPYDAADTPVSYTHLTLPTKRIV